MMSKFIKHFWVYQITPIHKRYSQFTSFPHVYQHAYIALQHQFFLEILSKSTPCNITDLWALQKVLSKSKTTKAGDTFPLTKLKTNHFYLSLGINDHTITEKLHNFPFSHLRPWQISKHWLSPSWGIAQLYFGCRIFWICKT